ncbi:alpha/beta hydrolase [Rhodococcoides trifolii]|uniref:Alpha/beta hydrolase n=1 Tax=Rhodococcoides trifolii TaxID=908250 RepID=A0A917FXR6_9NOCA|nr:alpha/beta fold hydrolase [Rhodococcus trifolii]GGG12283.1 alpha/beta hydrolase [Rhodococcus trifolii]
MPEIEVHTYGPTDGPEVLAIHGMTGHGQRWESWSKYLPEARIIAPDLIGHGRSRSTPPWSIDAQVEALVDVLDAHASGPVVVVGHSYGGAIAIHLARRSPERVRALALFDPAIGLDPDELLDVAMSTVQHSEYTDADEARAEKLGGAWRDVDPALVDAEIEEHLVTTDSGRVRWRLSVPAIVASWGELARPFVLPPADLPVTVVQAMQVQPPYVTAAFEAALRDSLPHMRYEHFDCDHMVPQAKPAESAELVRDLIARG